MLGGGLAGLSAARSLIEMGFDVTLVEKRPFLGGRGILILFAGRRYGKWTTANTSSWAAAPTT